MRVRILHEPMNMEVKCDQPIPIKCEQGIKHYSLIFHVLMQGRGMSQNRTGAYKGDPLPPGLKTVI